MVPITNYHCYCGTQICSPPVLVDNNGNLVWVDWSQELAIIVYKREQYIIILVFSTHVCSLTCGFFLRLQDVPNSISIVMLPYFLLTHLPLIFLLNKSVDLWISRCLTNSYLQSTLPCEALGIWRPFCVHHEKTDCWDVFIYYSYS